MVTSIKFLNRNPVNRATEGLVGLLGPGLLWDIEIGRRRKSGECLLPASCALYHSYNTSHKK